MNKSLITPDPAAPWVMELELDPALHSEKSKARYAVVLRAFYFWKGDRPINKGTVEEYCNHLHAMQNAPSTIRQALAVIKWWTRRAVDRAYQTYPREQADDIAAQGDRILAIREKSVAKGTRLPAGRHISNDELAALIDACVQDSSPAGVRDAAWIAVAIPTGARIDEMLKMTLKDLKYTETGVDVTIRHGKGDKARVVFLSGNALAALDAWLNVRTATPGALFCPIRKNGAIDIREMTYEAARLILGKRFRESSLAEHITWHDFRRTLAGNLFTNNIDPKTIQDQLGHVSINTTQKYDRRGDALRRVAISNIEVPYPKK